MRLLEWFRDQRLQMYLADKDRKYDERMRRLNGSPPAHNPADPENSWLYPLGTVAIGAALLAFVGWASS